MKWHMREVEEEGTMESTTLLSKQTKVAIIQEEQQKTETEDVEVLPEKGGIAGVYYGCCYKILFHR